MTSRPDDDFARPYIDRRGFAKTLGAVFVLSVGVPFGAVSAARSEEKYGADGESDGWRDDPRLFVSIDAKGDVTFFCTRQEMGQGVRTSLALALADEMEADLARVRAVQADADQAKWGNQDTDGSRSIRHFFMAMRRAGAAARSMLEQAAAMQWGVPHSEVRANNHILIHAPTGRKLGFGAVTAELAKIPVPARDRIALKTPSEFRYIGKDQVTGVDLFDMTTGRAEYGIDVKRPGLLYTVVARPPVMGGKLLRYDASRALAVPGVVKVVLIKQPKPGLPIQATGGVAVVARNSYAAIKGRQALDIVWDDGPHKVYSSDRYRSELRAAIRKPGKLVFNTGDVASAFSSADRRVEAEYYLPHLAHASMEPPSATVQISNGRCEAWACVQNPQGAREALASALGLAEGHVTVHVTLLGGGFGRKSQPDFVVEAGLVSQAMNGRPIKVLWTREDDITHDFYHTVSMERLEAGLDSKGRVNGLLYRTAAPTISSIFEPDPKHEGDDELAMGVTGLPFDIPAMRFENPEAVAHTRIGWFRAVSNVPHAFAVQCFVAELAHAAGRDHKDFLLELIGPARKIDPKRRGDTDNYGESPTLYPIDTKRLRDVVERAASAINWGRKLSKGQGIGLAAHHSFASYAACAVELISDEAGEIVIPRVVLAFDCGPIVNPDRVRAQAEGSVVMGLGLALTGEISFRNGRPQQSNFDTYRVMRMNETPKKIEVQLMEAGHAVPMGGAGEPCLPPVAPALCNAIFAATGKRIRDLPIANQLKV